MSYVFIFLPFFLFPLTYTFYLYSPLSFPYLYVLHIYLFFPPYIYIIHIRLTYLFPLFLHICFYLFNLLVLSPTYTYYVYIYFFILIIRITYNIIYIIIRISSTYNNKCIFSLYLFIFSDLFTKIFLQNPTTQNFSQNSIY